jgi:hypothetical protein
MHSNVRRGSLVKISSWAVRVVGVCAALLFVLLVATSIYCGAFASCQDVTWLGMSTVCAAFVLTTCCMACLLQLQQWAAHRIQPGPIAAPPAESIMVVVSAVAVAVAPLPAAVEQ